MKEIVGLILVIGGIVLGLYVGVWVCFIGGIVDVIESVCAPNLSAMAVALGVTKVVFAGVVGWASGVCLAIPGLAMIRN